MSCGCLQEVVEWRRAVQRDFMNMAREFVIVQVRQVLNLARAFVVVQSKSDNLLHQ